RIVRLPGNSSRRLDRETTLFARLTGTETAGRLVSKEEARQAVRRAIKTLPADYARVLELFELEGKSGADVSAIMGRTHGAIRMLLARARELLAERLGSFSHYLLAPAVQHPLPGPLVWGEDP